MVTYKFKRKKEHCKIKMASQDKRHKSERVNANTALYPTGFTCFVVPKVKPIKVYMVFSIYYTALSQGFNLFSKGAIPF